MSGNAFGAVYLGRGKEPSMRVEDTDMVVRMTADTSNSSAFIRGEGKQAFDAACFHYSVRNSKCLIAAFRVVEHVSRVIYLTIQRLLETGNADLEVANRHTVQ